MRDEAAHVLDSVRETIAIGERGGLPTQVTHHKIIGKANWGRSVETLRLIDEARARGVDATIDQYPYTASSTSIQGGLVPQWAQEGGREAMLKGLRDETTRGKVLAAIANSIENDRGGGDPGQRRPGGLHVGSEPGRQEPRAGAARSRPSGHHPAGGRARRRDRREGRLQRRLPRDQRGRSRADHEASGDDDRVGCGAGRADVRQERAPPARLRHLRARARRLRAREAGAHARGGGAQDVGVPGPARRARSIAA